MEFSGYVTEVKILLNEFLLAHKIQSVSSGEKICRPNTALLVRAVNLFAV